MRYIVTGPERIWVDDLLGYGQGPRYEEHDVYLVEAPTTAAARWKALRLARERSDRWVTDLGWEHPLSGVSVERAPQEDPSEWEGLYAP